MKYCDFLLILVFTILLITCLHFRREIDTNKKYIKTLQEDVIQLQEETQIFFQNIEIPKSSLGQISYTKFAGEE